MEEEREKKRETDRQSERKKHRERGKGKKGREGQDPITTSYPEHVTEAFRDIQSHSTSLP